MFFCVKKCCLHQHGLRFAIFEPFWAGGRWPGRRGNNLKIVKIENVLKMVQHGPKWSEMVLHCPNTSNWAFVGAFRGPFHVPRPFPCPEAHYHVRPSPRSPSVSPAIRLPGHPSTRHGDSGDRHGGLGFTPLKRPIFGGNILTVYCIFLSRASPYRDFPSPLDSLERTAQITWVREDGFCTIQLPRRLYWSNGPFCGQFEQFCPFPTNRICSVNKYDLWTFRVSRSGSRIGVARRSSWCITLGPISTCQFDPFYQSGPGRDRILPSNGLLPSRQKMLQNYSFLDTLAIFSGDLKKCNTCDGSSAYDTTA